MIETKEEWERKKKPELSFKNPILIKRIHFCHNVINLLIEAKSAWHVSETELYFPVLLHGGLSVKIQNSEAHI